MEAAMLVLSRKVNERIVIDGGIIITVVKIDRNQVRIGIEAPGEVPVFREELLIAARRGEESGAVAVAH
jgi:carbon storage regulator